MRCIPEEPGFGEGQLAEKAVWTALKDSLAGVHRGIPRICARAWGS